MCSLFYAYGCLVRRYDPAAQAFATALVRELVRRMDQPYVRGALGSTDMADLVQAAAQLYVVHGAPAQPRGPAAASATAAGPAAAAARAAAGAQGHPFQQQQGPGPGSHPQVPAEVRSLLDLVAGEVRRQLANKNSSLSPFTPGDLVRFLGSYALLQHRSSHAQPMLDVVASWVVQRIKARHMNCMSKGRHLAALLAAYADLDHASVTVPELLAATGEQVRRLAAQQHDRHTADAAAAAGPALTLAGSPSAPTAAAAPAAAAPAAGAWPATGPPDEGLGLQDLNSILASHLRLGYCPPLLLLHAIQPLVIHALPSSAPLDVACHLHLLSLVPGYRPGAAAVSLMLACVGSGGSGSEQLPPEALVQARLDAASLEWHE